MEFDLVFFDPPWGGMDYKTEHSGDYIFGNQKWQLPQRGM